MSNNCMGCNTYRHHDGVFKCRYPRADHINKGYIQL